MNPPSSRACCSLPPVPSHQTGTGDLDRLGGFAKMPHDGDVPHRRVFHKRSAAVQRLLLSKWMIYQAIYQKAVESGIFLFVFALIAALVTSVL